MFIGTYNCISFKLSNEDTKLLTKEVGSFVFVRTLPERWSPVLRILIGLITGFDLGKFIVFLKFVDNDGLKLKHVCEGEFEFLELIWVRVVSKVCLINITAYG